MLGIDTSAAAEAGCEPVAAAHPAPSTPATQRHRNARLGRRAVTRIPSRKARIRALDRQDGALAKFLLRTYASAPFDPEILVANHPSAEKRARQAERRRLRNRHAKSRVRTLVKSLRTSLGQRDAATAQEELRAAEAALRWAASKGVIPQRRASRTISRLAKRLQALR
jgi:small subunit ribosomal protein S20